MAAPPIMPDLCCDASISFPTKCGAVRPGADDEQVRLIYHEHAITQRFDRSLYTTFTEPSWKLVTTAKPIATQMTLKLLA